MAANNPERQPIPGDDLPVALADIDAVKRHLFWRWRKPLFLAFLRGLAAAFCFAALLYLLFTWWNPEAVRLSIVTIMGSVTVCVVVIVAMHAVSMAKVELRIYRKLEEMERRIRAGEVVLASEILG